VSNFSPPVFPSFRSQQRTHKLAGAAAPPPSGAGRRRGTIAPIDPLSRAQGLPLRFAPARGRNGGRECRPGPTPASPCRAPPLSGDVTAALRLRASWAFGSRSDGSDHIPLRFERAVHGARAHGQPLDLRSTVQLWPFPLRVPGFSRFCMLVLPPLKIFTNRSWFLCFSPCLT
jgi:hypothetical protein